MKYKKIGDVCTILSGYAFDSKQFSNDPQDFPLIRIRDIVRGRTETYTKEKFDEKYIVKKGELLIGMDGEFNIAPWNSQEALLNQRVCKIWCSSDDILDRYLLYFLPKVLKDIESKTSFVTVKHLSVKGINQIEIPLPPLEIQQKIAATLDTAAALLKLRQQQLAELDTLIQSVFYQMFGDPVRNEKGWELKPIGGTTKSIIAGWSVNGETRTKKPDEMAVLKVSAITQGIFRADEYKVISKEQKIKKYVFPQKGDLIFSRANTREMVGATAIVDRDYLDLLLPDKLWKILFLDFINVYFMKYILSTPAIRSEFSNQSTGTSGSMYNVSMEKFKNIKIPLPPLSLQTQFAAIVQKIDQQKALVQQSIDETQILFDSLMSRYFD